MIFTLGDAKTFCCKYVADGRSTPGAKQMAYQIQAASAPEKLAKLQRQLASATVKAPQDGLVVYALGMVSVDTWRSKWMARASIEDTDTKRATWSLSKNRLLKLRFAIHLDDKVWLIQEDSEEGRQA